MAATPSKLSHDQPARAIDQVDPTLLRQCFDMAGVILLGLDPTGRITLINAFGCELLGHADRELIGRDWFDTCLAPEDRAEVRSVFQRLMVGEGAGDELTQVEGAVVSRDGSRRAILWQNRILRDDAGAVVGTISSGEDITDRNRAVNALVESEARLRGVLGIAVDAIITIDDRGKIESVNPATERLFGFTQQEMVGRNVNMLMPEPYRKQHTRYIDKYLRTGEGRVIGVGREVRARRKDGSTFPADLAISEIRLDERRLFTGILRDITDRRRLEADVLRIAGEERQRIGRDLHDGVGQELTGAAFLAGVLKSKLKAKGLRDESDAADEVKALINAAIDHTRALVKGLCPVNLEAEGLMVSLNELAESVNRMRGLRCQFICDDPVLIDDHDTATHLHYIAHEAVNNALKHSGATAITIRLTDDGDHTCLTISDNGKGMPDDLEYSTGRGRHIMSYRARMIGGAIEIRHPDSGGTTIACCFDHHTPPHGE